MGAYLSTPCLEKKSEDFTDSQKFSYGVSGMQGWRISMEDAHNCVPVLDEDASLFGVYDGHGGSEVANYCSLHFAEILKTTNSYRNGHYKEALQETFMNIDKSLMEPEVIRELKVLADRDPGDGPPTEVDYKTKEQEEEYDEDETKLLYEEATMSIEDLLARYGRAANEAKTVFNKIKEDSIVEIESVPAQTTTKTDPEPSTCDAEVTSSSGRASKTSLKAKSLESDQNSSMNGLKCVSESSKPSEVDQVMSAEVSSSTLNIDTGDDVSKISDPCYVTDKSTVETECAKGDSKENEAITTKSNVKIKPSGKVSVSKIKQHSSTSKLLAEVEEEVNADDESEDSDSEDGFHSDEAVEGSSDSDDEESEEEEDDEDEEEDVERIDISELKRTNPMSNIEEPGKDSGTTAVIALLKGRELYVANAGDSRCVLCRNGKAVDMSEDHKPEDDGEMKRIKAAGGHVNTQGRVNGGLNLSRAIGDHCYKANADLELKDQMISAMPDVKKVCLKPGDEFIVLACDGIWNVFSSQEVVDFIRTRMPIPDSKDGNFKLSSICEELFDMSLAPDAMGDGTGCDNMTCIVVDFDRTWLENCEKKYPMFETETLPFMASDKEVQSKNCNHAAGDVNSSNDLEGELCNEVNRNISSCDDVNCDGDDNTEKVKSNLASKRLRQDDDINTNNIQQDQVESSTKRPKVA